MNFDSKLPTIGENKPYSGTTSSTEEYDSLNNTNTTSSVSTVTEEYDSTSTTSTDNFDNELRNFDDEEFLDENLLRGIFAYGFEKPSNIQQKAILPMIRGRDIIAQAQSGTGKTGAFSIGGIQKLSEESNPNSKIIVISPTKELAIQTNDVINHIGSHLDNIKSNSFIGGTTIKENVKNINDGTNVICGTPGRINDLFRRTILKSEDIILLIIDEADEMLSRDFTEQVKEIYRNLNENTQVVLFSATLTFAVKELSKKILNNPYEITIKNEELTLDGIQQFFVYHFESDNKFDTICDLYRMITIGSCIIYCNTKSKVEKLVKEMNNLDFTVDFMHGEMEPSERNKAMKNFKNGASRVLITTDLLARGIDVQSVSLVINYDIPNNRENYIHRIGRSGRFGRKGVSISFVEGDEEYSNLKDIENYYLTEIKELPADINEKI